jgi:hypothetical protein
MFTAEAIEKKRSRQGWALAGAMEVTIAARLAQVS